MVWELKEALALLQELRKDADMARLGDQALSAGSGDRSA